MSPVGEYAVVPATRPDSPLLAKSDCTEILLEAVHIRLGILRISDRPTMPEEGDAIHCVTQQRPAVRRGDG